MGRHAAHKLMPEEAIRESQEIHRTKSGADFAGGGRMEQKRGVLFLNDPLDAGSMQRIQTDDAASATLVFEESGCYLARAQAELWRLRQSCDWICVAAKGRAAAIAAALAAQLPTDRLAMIEGKLFSPERMRMPRELMRLEAYARRNLSLVISEILLVGASEGEIKGLLRGLRRPRLCALEYDGADQTDWRELLTAEWEQVCRNNLLIL